MDVPLLSIRHLVKCLLVAICQHCEVISGYLFDLSKRLRLVLLWVRRLDNPIFLQLGEEEVGDLRVLEPTPIHLLVQLDDICEA